MVCAQSEWLTDPRFATAPSRLKNIDALFAGGVVYDKFRGKAAALA